jgi:hypothetical protein
MAFSIGTLLALVIGVFARVVGLDRDRAFFPTVMIVIALLYGLFACIGGFTPLVAEIGPSAGFVALAVAGFRKSQWWTVVALAGHGLFDLLHPHVIANPGVPAWWPDFCSAYDLTAAVFLGVLLVRGNREPRI